MCKRNIWEPLVKNQLEPGVTGKYTETAVCITFIIHLLNQKRTIHEGKINKITEPLNVLHKN